MEVGDLVAVGGDDHRLVLPEFHRVAGVFDERGHIGADEHLALTHAEHQRGGALGGHDGARLVGVGEHQREVALQPAQHRQHRGGEVPGGVTAPVLPRDQVHGDLGVGVAGKLHPGGLQLTAQRGEVLDDAVVHHRDLPGRVAQVVLRSVGRPWVAHGYGPTRCARSAWPGRRREGGLQIDQPAGAAAHRSPPRPLTSATRRVVAPVLHPARRIDDDVAGVARAHVADDSAHSHSGSAIPAYRPLGYGHRVARTKKLFKALKRRGPHRVLRGDLAFAGLPGIVYTPESGMNLAGVAFGHDWLAGVDRYMNARARRPGHCRRGTGHRDGRRRR